MAQAEPSIAVAIPCYRVKSHILDVIAQIGPEVRWIVVVDDACPERTADHVEANCRDPRVVVVRHERNRGVGGATKTGWRKGLELGADILVKLDGDGQMEPKAIPAIVRPIVDGAADYSKGNRFWDLESLAEMPPVRRFGNSVLCFINKAVTGYWNLLDPTNGFVAIHRAVARALPWDKIDDRFFFESDLLFRLATISAVVEDVPIRARYGEEKSNLKIGKVILEFPGKYVTRFSKRIAYKYFVRDFNIGSLQLMLGACFLLFGVSWGAWQWRVAAMAGIPAPTGTIMLAALPVIIGFQLLLAGVQYDVSSVPRRPIHLRLRFSEY